MKEKDAKGKKDVNEKRADKHSHQYAYRHKCVQKCKKIVKKRITCFWWFHVVWKKFHVVLPGSDWFLHMAASSSNCLVLLSYSMLAFIANSFRLFRVIPLGLGQSVQYFMNNFFNTDVLYVYNLPYVHHIHSVKKNPLNAKS